MILSLLTLKGGQGKTSLAINLADELVALGFNVCLVDADNQQSLFDFCFHRYKKICDYFKYENKKQIKKLGDDYDVVIIDNSPRINNILEDVLNLTDFVIVPTKLDLFSFWANVELIKKLQDNESNFAFLFNCVKHFQTSLKNEFEEKLKEFGVKIFKQKISESNDWPKSQNELKTLREINSKKLAEIQLMIKELEEF